MKKFDERVKEFDKDMQALQKKHHVAIYAANVVVNKEGEVAPVVRVGDAEDKSIIKK